MEKLSLNELIQQIEEDVRIRMTEEGVTDADWDDFEDDYFFAEVERKIANAEPGWFLLLREYYPESINQTPWEETPDKKVDDYIEELKSTMDYLWEKFDHDMENGETRDLDADFFQCQQILESFGINYNPSNA